MKESKLSDKKIITTLEKRGFIEICPHESKNKKTGEMIMNKYAASQKLWRVIKERDEYYYEIKLSGVVIDRIRVEDPALSYLKQERII